MKLIVETKDNLQVYFPGPDNHARHDRLSVVVNSQVMQMKQAQGELIVRGQVNDDATDEKFVEHLAACEGDAELALASFVEEYPVEVQEPKAKPEPKAKGKTEDKKEA